MPHRKHQWHGWAVAPCKSASTSVPRTASIRDCASRTSATYPYAHQPSPGKSIRSIRESWDWLKIFGLQRNPSTDITRIGMIRPETREMRWAVGPAPCPPSAVPTPRLVSAADAGLLGAVLLRAHSPHLPARSLHAPRHAPLYAAEGQSPPCGVFVTFSITLHNTMDPLPPPAVQGGAARTRRRQGHRGCEGDGKQWRDVSITMSPDHWI